MLSIFYLTQVGFLKFKVGETKLNRSKINKENCCSILRIDIAPSKQEVTKSDIKIFSDINHFYLRILFCYRQFFGTELQFHKKKYFSKMLPKGSDHLGPS